MDHGASEIIFRIISAYSVFSLFLQDEEGTRAPSPASTSPPHQTQKIEKLRTYTGYVPTNLQTHQLINSIHGYIYINIGNEEVKSKGSMNKPTNNPNSYGLMDNLTLSYDGKRCYFLTYRL